MRGETPHCGSATSPLQARTRRRLQTDVAGLVFSPRVQHCASRGARRPCRLVDRNQFDYHDQLRSIVCSSPSATTSIASPYRRRDRSPAMMRTRAVCFCRNVSDCGPMSQILVEMHFSCVRRPNKIMISFHLNRAKQIRGQIEIAYRSDDGWWIWHRGRTEIIRGVEPGDRLVGV